MQEEHVVESYGLCDCCGEAEATVEKKSGEHYCNACDELADDI